MSLRRNRPRRSRESQEPWVPYSSGRITRSRARAIAALELADRNVRNEIRVNDELALTLVSNNVHSLALRRLRKDLEEMYLDPPENCSAKLIDDNIFYWEATLIGPSGSPYENGVFNLRLHFPVTYPLKPPNVQFCTKIYHSNISHEGLICIDILNAHWSPALCVSKILLSILSLLTDANPFDPLVPQVAEKYLNNRQEHDAIARQWTQKYAIQPTIAARTDQD